MMAQFPEEVQLTDRKEREQVGKQINEGFARVEKQEMPGGVADIPTQPVAPKLSEDDIRRLVGEGNFQSAKEGGQHNSINS
ncbi:hypothetical protein SK066_11275 [Paenibacillus hunanensis]|uniref:hypothetical protein n=1 Tax=Paenibacillus hunanensis TaxID=539262 RepID=UPI0020274CD4|nr:hypothetical protein [Paenibacillus hunanensis]MCL9662741.1 hypothetical protein [Paenibacillus hunanensis]WPP43468.1 hypothetical protein SK066_11275 [Paenibacillus hunanensis]